MTTVREASAAVMIAVLHACRGEGSLTSCWYLAGRKEGRVGERVGERGMCEDAMM